MSRTLSMLKGMRDYYIISLDLLNKLTDQHTSSEKGRRFVEAVVKRWDRKSYFISSYEKKVLEELDKLKEYYRQLKERGENTHQKQKERQKTEPEQIRERERRNTAIGENFDKFKAVNAEIDFRNIGNDRRKLFNLLKVFNEIFDCEMFSAEDHGTHFTCSWNMSAYYLTSNFNRKCQDLKTKRLHFQMVHDYFGILQTKIQEFKETNDENPWDRYGSLTWQKIYFNEVQEV